MEDLTSGNENYNIEVRLPDLKNLAAWATFKAIIEIIFGALSCIGIITAAFGIPMIISGVRLLGAADEMKKYIAHKDTKNIAETFIKMNQYFKVKGISLIILIIFSFIMFFLYILLVLYLYQNMMPDIISELPSTLSLAF